MVGAASMLYYHLGLFMPRSLEVSAARGLGNTYSFGDDFYPIWLTTKQWRVEHRDPYSPEMTREIQEGLFGRPLDPHIPTDPKDLRMFAHPAFTILLLWPAAEMPFAVSRVVLVVLLAAMTFASVLFWMRALVWRLSWSWLVVIFLLTLCSYPVLEGLYAAQLGLMVAFLLAGSIFALQRGQLLLAGILMALTTIKPQVTLLVIFYLFLWSCRDWRRRGRFCIGLFATTLLLVGAALVVWPHWIQSWARVALQYHRYARPALLGEVLASQLGRKAGPATFMMIAGAIAVAATLAWRNRTAESYSLRFWLTLTLLLSVTTITLLPGQAVYDDVILLPGIFLLARRWQELCSSRILKVLMATGAALLLWPWFASFSLIALRPLLSRQQFYSTAVLALPLRTAAAFPFVIVALLALAIHRAQPAGADDGMSLPS